MLVQVTKLRESEAPLHPNNIKVGATYIGNMDRSPTVGERFIITGISWKYHQRGLNTTPVVRIIDENTFETVNSIYQISEYHEQ